jgi:hypothetical protein
VNPDGTHGPEQDRAERLMAQGPIQNVRRIMELEDAARPFSDEVTCLDPTCTHKVCVLNRILEDA